MLEMLRLPSESLTHLFLTSHEEHARAGTWDIPLAFCYWPTYTSLTYTNTLSFDPLDNFPVPNNTGTCISQSYCELRWVDNFRNHLSNLSWQ
jgi:hypothetical protein